jgi:hypothetical protein
MDKGLVERYMFNQTMYKRIVGKYEFSQQIKMICS